MVVISVSISARELKDFEDMAKQTGYSSRSDAVRDALHRFVAGNNWINDLDGKVSCVLSVIYVDRKKHQVHDIIHKHSEVVHSSMHTHIDHRCVEQVVLEGPSADVRELLAELSAQKDVRVTISMF